MATKVLMVTTSYPRHATDYSGVFVHALARALQAAGVELHILAPADVDDAAGPDPGGPTVRRFHYFLPALERLFHRPAGGLPQRLRKASPVLCLLPFAMFAMAWNVLRFCRRFDVVHCHWLPTALLAFLPCRIHGKPLVVTVSGSDVNLFRKSRLGRRLMGFVLRRCAAVISVNDEFSGFLRGLAPDVAERILHVPYGVRQASRSRPLDPGAESGLRLLFVGGMTEQKGLADLKAALPALGPAGSAWRLTLIGPEPAAGERWFWDWLASAGEAVSFRGACAQHEVLDAMLQHDLLVFPSHAEGRPNVVLEAMSNGLPVLATKLPGIEEVAEDGVHAVLVPPKSPGELARALTWCSANREALAGYSQRARARIRELGLTWENCAEAYVRVYESLAAAHG